MKYAFYTSNFGDCGDARLLAEIASEAGAAGWDGYFLWDHVAWPGMEPIVDPWIALAAMAMRTERILLGQVPFLLEIREGDTSSDRVVAGAT